MMSGIQPQDIIVQVNKAKVSSLKQYTTEMNKASEKKSVILLVKRGKSNFLSDCNKIERLIFLKYQKGRR